jgi:very-short-patch-repair endonuclease
MNNRTAYFIADFFCAEKKPIVEVDGGIHDKQKEYDEYRSFILSKLNIKVIRFSNEQVIGDIELVLQELERAVKG